MKTEVTELPESRARLEVTVEPEVLGKRIDRAAKQMANEMKLPGFRKGKVPPQLVMQRIGREAVLEQAIRDSLPEWYEQAIVDSGLPTIGDPKLDVDDLPAEGQELAFSIEIGVRPKATLGEYRGLEVGKAEVEVPDSDVDAEIDRLREGLGSLNPVNRAAAAGDVLVIDFEGKIDGETFEGSTGNDFTIELGSESLMAEFDAGLTGKSAGDETEIEVAFPEDHQDEAVAGKTATFAIKVGEVREKVLPALDDDFASSASEFDTVDELRNEIRTRIAAVLEQRAEAEFREAAVEAAAENARVELPNDLVHARAHELWERFERGLQARGIDPQMYAQMQGKDRHDLIDEGEDSARISLRREATLAAVAEAEQLEPSDDEMVDALGPGEGKDSPQKILARLRETGRDALLREEVRLRKAAELIAEQAKAVPKPVEPEPIEPDTKAPEPDAAPAEAEPSKLWTPGDP